MEEIGFGVDICSMLRGGLDRRGLQNITRLHSCLAHNTLVAQRIFLQRMRFCASSSAIPSYRSSRPDNQSTRPNRITINYIPFNAQSIGPKGTQTGPVRVSTRLQTAGPFRWPITQHHATTASRQTKTNKRWSPRPKSSSMPPGSPTDHRR